jgi:hypothetical protein
MDELARQFAVTHDPEVKQKIEPLRHPMEEARTSAPHSSNIPRGTGRSDFNPNAMKRLFSNDLAF